MLYDLVPIHLLLRVVRVDDGNREGLLRGCSYSNGLTIVTAGAAPADITVVYV